MKEIGHVCKYRMGRRKRLDQRCMNLDVFYNRKYACYFHHIRLFVRPSVRSTSCISAATTGRISVKFDIVIFMKICQEIPDLVKMQENLRQCIIRTKCIYMVNCPLNLHTNHHLDLEFIWSRRHKPHANLPQCSIISILLNLLKSLCVLVAAEQNEG